MKHCFRLLPAFVLGLLSSMQVNAERVVADASSSAAGPATFYAQQTNGLTFGDPANTTWVFKRSGQQCELQRRVTAYGIARFVAAADAASMRFELETAAGLLIQTPVRLQRVAPAWHPHYPHNEALGLLPQVDGYGVWADAIRARAMLMDLYNGYDQVLFADGAFAAAAMFKIRLAADHFRSSYRQFTACLQAQNSQHGFASLNRARVHFPTDGHRLDPKARERIERVARLIRADGSVRRIFIDGHTDASGGERHNVQLSQRRARVVTRALTALGVAADKIVMRYHAHHYPVANNASHAGKAANRRTTIRLEREDTQLAQR